MAIIIISLSSFTQLFQADEQFIIKGRIINVPNNTKIELLDIGDGNSVNITSSFVKNNSFELKGKCNKTTMACLVIKSEEEPIYLILSGGETVINGDIKKIESIKFTGNKIIQEFVTVTEMIKQSEELIFALNDKSNSLTAIAKIKENDQNILAAYQNFSSSMINFIKGHPDSYASNYLLLIGHKLLDDPITAEKAYGYLSDANKNNFYVKTVKDKIKEKTTEGIGSSAKNFTLNNTVGKPVSLNDFKGKYVLIDFWASWCGPCRNENPNVARAYRLFNNKNFTVLGVSLDEKKADWLKAIKKDRLTWAHISDLKGWKNAVAVQYGVKSIPQNILINPQGKIIAKNLRGFSLSQFLSNELK